MEEGQALHEVRKTVTQDQINWYARVSGDGNLIHLDPEFAAQGPFGRIVAHGMLVLAFLSEMLTQAFGRSWLESGRLKVRFRAPVYPGEDVVAFGRITRLTVEGGNCHILCQVGCRKADGQEVITGEASVVVPEG
ncbi:MAG: MaoC family dehydratase [Chloroflexota bacterium]